MSDADLQQFFDLIAAHPDLNQFDGERPELVAWVENELGVIIPPQYRRFIEILGVGNFGSSEFAGPTEEHADEWPDVVFTARWEQRLGGMPASYLPVMEDGMGGVYILDTLKKPEPPVEIWTSGSDEAGDQLEQCYEDFGAMALDSARQSLEIEDLPVPPIVPE